ncbi:MAG: PEP-CTERM sorting domain-containing protein [Candidatus Omnitrophica bacterium]|nr:PEP-CTERM sorting domain-containing protein [Candidatus Omnitrophota bacterium]
MKRYAVAVIGILLSLGVVATPASAAVFVAGADNQVFFVNFENLYDSTGKWLNPFTAPVPGQILSGIIGLNGLRVNNVDSDFDDTTFQLSGVFAQEIVSIDAMTGTLTLGVPTVTTYYKDLDLSGGITAGDDVYSTGLAPGSEMFAFYLQQSPDPVTTLESDGTMLDDVTKATDGSLFLTLGFTDPGAGVDPGYAFTALFPPPLFPAGLSFAGLNLIQNNSGFTFAGLDNPFENVFNGTLQQVVYQTSFNLNPPGLNNPNPDPGTSPWEFISNDPALIHPDTVIPEPSSMWLLGMGLGSFGVFRRKKFLV